MFVTYRAYIEQVMTAMNETHPNFASFRPLLGCVYTYNYSPIYKDTLPYYDIFPITCVLSMDKHGFVGLNFHYIPYHERLQLLQLLLKFERRANNTKILKPDLFFLQKLSKSYFSFALKRYNWKHVRSKMMRITPEGWEEVICLPVISFKKKPVNIVWRDFIKTKWTKRGNLR